MEPLTDRLSIPIAVAIGLALAVLTDAHRGLQVAAFAAVLFAAVWVRRFGGAWFCYGVTTRMGFFLATGGRRPAC